MQFRHAGAADAPQIQALTKKAYAKWVPVLGRPPKPMVADYQAAVRDHILDLLVDARGGVMGDAIIGLVELIPAKDHWLIENVAVDPDQQGKGYGRQLVAHAEDLTRAAGLNIVRLYTNKLFAENIALYLKLGYRIDNEEPFKGGHLVHMSKVVG
jgi:GNAT superfamily N-acetyltransferase